MSDQFVMVMWSTSFFLIENYQEEIRDTDFTAKILQVQTVLLNSVKTCAFYLIVQAHINTTIKKKSILEIHATTKFLLKLTKAYVLNSLQCLYKYMDQKGCNAGHKEVRRCHTRGEFGESIAYRQRSRQARDITKSPKLS